MPTIISTFTNSDIHYAHAHSKEIRGYPSHLHNVYEFLFVKTGNAIYTVEEKSYRISPFSLVITRPLTIHSITFQTPAVYDRYDLLFDNTVLSHDILSALPLLPDVLQCDTNAIIIDLFSKLDYYCEHLNSEDLRFLVGHLIEEIILNVRIEMQGSMAQNQHTTNTLVRQALTYISQHLCDPLSVEDVCTHLHISQSYLLQLFNKHLSISPKKYIMSKRLAMAQLALRSGEKPTDVCKQFGFCDYSTFFRGYIHYFGYAPSQELEHPFSPLTLI